MNKEFVDMSVYTGRDVSELKGRVSKNRGRKKIEDNGQARIDLKIKTEGEMMKYRARVFSQQDYYMKFGECLEIIAADCKEKFGNTIDPNSAIPISSFAPSND